MITIRVVGDRQVIAQLKEMPTSVHAALVIKTKYLANKLRNYIRTDKLSGQVLHVRSGALRRSIQWDIIESVKAVFGRVFSAGDVKYAGIHEFGGKTSPHVIEPRKADALSFMMGGKRVFFKRVNHPGSVMPERSFMRTGLSDKAEEITTELKEAVFEAAVKGTL